MGFRKRLLLMLLAAALGSCAIWLRVFQLQALDGSTWREAARSLREKRERTTGPRGRILAQDGTVLAEDIPVPRVSLVPWEWLRRDRWRCTACGLVHHPLGPSGKRPPRRCLCRVPGATLVALPPGDVAPLETMLGLERGDIGRFAEQRIARLGALAERYTERLRAGGEEESFIEDKTDLFLEDMLRRPAPIPDVVVPPEAVSEVVLDEEGRYHGLRIETVARRVHPQGDLAAQLFGYTAPLVREEYERLRAAYGSAIEPDALIGRRGLERTYDGALRGQPGWRRLARDENGSFNVLLEEDRPQPGLEVRLSLSVAATLEAQRLLERYATAEGFNPGGRPSAGFVAMYGDTGEIVAWGETPRFDPDRDLARINDTSWDDAAYDDATGTWRPVHDLPDGESPDTWRAQLVQPDGIVLSRVLEIPVEPGSTMKPLIALAMLESGRGLPWERFVCTGHGDKPTCHMAHGSLDIVEALCVSCNRWFAFTLGGDHPLRPFYRGAVAGFVDRVGFGHAVFGDAIGSGGRGFWCRRAEWKEGEEPRIGLHDMRYLAIGQGPVTTTPLHMARVAALLANGGRLVTPHVVASIGGAPPQWPTTDLRVSAETLSRVREGLYRVVNEPGGTAARVDWSGIPATVYGKTGTAQVGKPYRPGADDVPEDGPWHHWFVGWAESPNGRPLVFAALLYARTEPAAGSTAAPLVADFLRWWYAESRP